MGKNDKIVVAPCHTCKNYNGNFTCLAYPEGIPDAIKVRGSQHENVRKDQDNDIVFEENKAQTKSVF